jgi:hypothetical protein
MNLDNEIFDSIKDHSKENPQNLVSIIDYVDYHQKLIITFEELSEGLVRLIKDGKILEVDNQRYCENTSGQVIKTFTNFSQDDYREALDRYKSL